MRSLARHWFLIVLLLANGIVFLLTPGGCEGEQTLEEITSQWYSRVDAFPPPEDGKVFIEVGDTTYWYNDGQLESKTVK
jgi:hypothetical protein